MSADTADFSARALAGVTTAQTPQDIARATRSLLKEAGAQLAGRKRGLDRRVRRNSFDVDDHRTNVWRPINGGSKLAGLRWRDCMLKLCREYDLVGKQKGRMGPLGPHTRDVFAAMLELVDFASGRLEPSYAKLMSMTGYAKSTISSALRRLRAHGFLDWVRRSRLVDTDDGVAREQTSNAFFFDVGRLPKRARLRFMGLLARRERAAEGAASPQAAPAPAPAEAARPLEAGDPELRAALQRLQALIDDGAE